MADLKKMTVQALRDLARKAFGPGHSRLRTKEELLEALQAAERKVATAAGKAGRKVKQAAGLTKKKAAPAARAGKPKAAAAGPAAKAPAAPARKAAPKRKGKAGEAAREAVRAVREVAGAARAGARRVRAALRQEPEPDPEGYMVARVAGEDALRGAPHPMTESAVEESRGRSRRGGVAPPPPDPGFDEHLGELPWSYADDALVALPRDPRTLFLYWDHAAETLRATFEGLDGGRPQLWVFRRRTGGWDRVRTVEFALESRSYYVHDLEPGSVYRAEIHVVDRQGRERLLPRASNETWLPPVGPSPIVDDRFMRIEWGEPLQRLLREAHPGSPFPDDIRAQLARLSDWSRFAGRVWGGSAGGMGGRPFSPAAAPSSPTSPSSPWSRPDGEGR